nr:MAG TPA: DNA TOPOISOMERASE IV, B SUBUNIT [Caudoviricetes sp.]
MSYNAKSIQQLTFRQGVRKRVGIYLGSADHTGVMAGLLELVNNATDEALVCPAANKIEIEIGPDWASCRDYGRGMPHGENDFSKEVMINLLTENHSGAKFDDNAYGGKSRGLNGTGSAATCCSSDWFKISSYRDDAEWYMEFEKGIPKWDVCQKKPLNGKKNGTYICYKPSQEVFSAEPIQFNYKEICEQMKEYSYFNKGITFIIKNAITGETKTYMSKNGLMDFVKENLDKPIHKAPLHYVNSENGIDVEIILQWTSNREEKFYLFSNGGENENGGTPITGIKTALTNFFKKKLKGEAQADILRKGLVYVCSVNLKDPIYDGQTKSKITNPELRGLCQRATTQMLESFEQQHAEEFQRVLDLLAKEQKAELAAERARKQVLEAQKEVEKTQKKKYIASDKLKDAEFLGQNATLLVVEGNSAMASVGVARDEKSYGIMCIRGKTINCLSNDEEKIYQNEEIKLLLSALNIVPGHYDGRKLRYGRVGICTDSDSDGYHIGLLLMAALQYLAPQFIEEGRLGWLRSPLYIVKNGKNETYYFTDEEMDAARGRISGVVQRNKGLGSLTEEQAHNSMFNPEYQRFDIFQTSPEARDLLCALMGKDVEPRTDFIFKNVDFSTIRE